MERVLVRWTKNFYFLTAELIVEVSEKIFTSVPLVGNKASDVYSSAELKVLEAKNHCQTQDLCELIDLLINVWLYAIYYQPKVEKMAKLLDEENVPDIVAQTVSEVWGCPKMLNAIERLASETCSGQPQAQSISWVVQDVIGSSGAAFGEPQVELQLGTTRGSKTIVLDMQQLGSLYQTTNEIQKSLDRLLER